MDRQLVAVLVEPIRREFALTDAHMGLFSGPAFAAFHTTLACRWRGSQIGTTASTS